MQQVNRSGGGRALVLIMIMAVLAVLAVLGVIGTHLITALMPAHRVPTDVSVQLTPDATGTRVTVVERARSGTLPATLELGLWSKDAGRVGTGGRLTDAPLVYSDARDGQGRQLPADQLSRRRLTVRTDGHVLQVSFHVDAVHGRRVVYPVPGSEQTAWTTVQIPSSGVRCLTNNSATDPNDLEFEPCTLTGSALDSTHNNYAVRLELT